MVGTVGDTPCAKHLIGPLGYLDDQKRERAPTRRKACVRGDEAVSLGSRAGQIVSVPFGYSLGRPAAAKRIATFRPPGSESLNGQDGASAGRGKYSERLFSHRCALQCAAVSQNRKCPLRNNEAKTLC